MPLVPSLLLLAALLPGPAGSLSTSARGGEWQEAGASLTPAARVGLAFVLEHMPAHDREALDPARVADQVALAYEVRGKVAWGAALPEEVFLNDVVAPSHINEARDLLRRDLAGRFLERVQDLPSSGEAALLLNRHVFPELGVQYSTARRRADQGPKETIETGLASCTGLAILLAESARACGVPARIAGIHTWPDKPGNHTWVEVWDTADGRWHHVGAAEPDARGLDHVWFAGDAALATPGSREHGIWAASYARTEDLFPLVWLPEQDYVHAVDVTERYLPADRTAARRVHVDVLGVTGARVRVPVALELRYGAGDAARVERREGLTKDATADTNDHLTFALEPAALAGAEVHLVVAGTPESAVLSLDGEGDRYVERRLGIADDELGALLARDPARARARLWGEFASSPEHAALRADYEAGRVRTADRESPWTAKEVGEQPEDGWPLVIAMHGGGGVPPEVNDSQWRHMQVYYRDHPEIGGYRYLALRAPNDAWNGFYDDAIAPLVEELVLQQVLFAGVDADRVSIVGYSHGGYGVWVIAPKIPDRFAAAHASAAAPSDGESRLANLFALPFTYMCGEGDEAYGRIERNHRAQTAFATLRGERTDAWYPARFEHVPGKGHGGLPDRDKTLQLVPHRRDPLPRELVWQPSDNRIRDHYWVSIDHPTDGQRLHVTLMTDGPDRPRVRVDAEGVDTLTLWLDDRLVGDATALDVVTPDGTHTLPIEPTVAAMRASLARWRDPRRIYTARVELPLH